MKQHRIPGNFDGSLALLPNILSQTTENEIDIESYYIVVNLIVYLNELDKGKDLDYISGYKRKLSFRK